MAILLPASVSRVFAGPLLTLLLFASPLSAATLDVPRSHATLSGIGVIHGWKCTAGRLTVRFDGGAPLPLLYGAQRKDVQQAGACSRANVGFVSIMNWSELSDGVHTAVVYDNGVEFARSTFTVVTPGMAFYTGGGECVVPDFPDFNQEARFRWDFSTQHMELAGIGDMGDGDDLAGVSDTDLTPLAFVLDRPAWMIEVPGIDDWKRISSAIDPNKAGDRVVPAPARIEFRRRPLPGTIKMPSDPTFRVPVEGAEIGGRIYGKRGQRSGLSTVFALGGVLDMLPEQTAFELGALRDRYALVIQMPWPHPTMPGHSHHRCFVIVFNLVQRTDAGGLDTLAYFATTEWRDATDSTKLTGTCVPPVSPMYSTRLKIY